MDHLIARHRLPGEPDLSRPPLRVTGAAARRPPLAPFENANSLHLISLDLTARN